MAAVFTQKDLIFFKSQAKLRQWFEKNHDKVAVMQLGFYKKATGKPSVTYKESVDEALCFGWIDGVRNAVDEEVYTNRFTPRRPRSIWSAVNLKRIDELFKSGAVHPAGKKVFEARDITRTNVYARENSQQEFAPAQEKQFRKNKKAWKFFESQPPSYRKLVINWVTSAKQEETRQRRLENLIADSAAGLRIKQLRQKSK